MKKILSMFLVLCMVVTLLPVSAMAEEASVTIGTSGEIISFAPLAGTEKTRALGTSIQDLVLPEILTVTVRTAVPADENPTQDSGSPDESVTSGDAAVATTSSAIEAELDEPEDTGEAAEPEWKETTMDIPVTWVSPDYDMNTEGEYVFTPKIEGYTVRASLPEITVTVGEMPPIAAVVLDSGGAAKDSYDTFENALYHAETGETVKLLKEITLAAPASITDKSITLDLNGKKLTSAWAQTLTYTGTSDKTLTITDSADGGVVENTYGPKEGKALVNNSTGTVEVLGGTIRSTGVYGYGIHNASTGTITVSGGSVEATGDQYASGLYYFARAIDNSGGGVVNISGTAQVTGVTGNGYAITSNKASGVVNISGGVVSSEKNFALGGSESGRIKGRVNITGGEIRSGIDLANGTTVNISGGTLAPGKISVPVDSTLVITGGNMGFNLYGGVAVNGQVPPVTVVPYVLTIPGEGNKAVTELTVTPELDYTYGMNDVKTDDSGNLTVCLPLGKTGVSVTIDGTTYSGETVRVSEEYSNWGYTATLTPPAPSYTITANPTTKDFGSLTIGYTAPAAQTITITNTGNSSVTLTQPTSTNYTIGALSTTTLAENGTATFTVAPKAGLTVGNYNEPLAVSTNHSTNATVSLSFSVTAAPTYTITANPTSKNFGSLAVGYSAPAAQTVTITNTGNSSVTLTQPTSTNYTIGALSTTTLAANGTATFTVAPKAGLAVGNYNETLTVSTDHSTTATVELSFSVTAAPTYTVTFNPNGGTVTETSRSIVPGAAVGALPTPTRSRSYSFDGWYTAASGGTQISASTTVNANVTYYAHWTYTGGGGSGSGGGSSSNDKSSSVIVTPPAPDKPNSPTQGEIKVSGTVDSKGNITVNITGKTVTDAFDKALAEAKKNGTEQNGIAVVLHVDTGNKTGSNVTVNLPKAVQDTIIAKKIVNTIVVVDNPNIRVGMDLATVQEINKQAKSDVNITATRTDSGKLTTEAKKVIGSRPVFDLKVNYGNGKAISSFGAGSVSVTIPYTLGANEKAGNVQAVYVDSKGKVHWLINSAYDSVEQVLRFSTDHFSTYGIGYKQTGTAFTDIAGHWAKEDIEFVVSRGLFSGTSETKFSPNTAMTRGMFVTALGRLANADVSSYAKSSFTDVKGDAYYMGYIEWASKNNIVNGVGNGKFAPDQSITREQMAVIMSNYAKTIGYTLPKVHIENIFADNAKISTYAKEAVKQMQMAGVISGKNSNLFDPQSNTTRAEVSAVLRRFVELAISSDTAQGWSMNDSGKWMYFKDGKPLTGKKDIDGATYTFDQYGVTADVPKKLKCITYTVQKGDSCWLIAHKLDCTISELEQLNSKSRLDLIHPGDVLRVPEK
ncbi:MAG: S-layer homology domain-containing protein [Angelakisella sp.]|nr:S-layer homology domain-containing protein [Angelakisella sp.]